MHGVQSFIFANNKDRYQLRYCWNPHL